MDVNLEGRRLDKVRPFRYLGSLVNEDGKCSSEMRSRIAIGRLRIKYSLQAAQNEVHKETKFPK